MAQWAKALAAAKPDYLSLIPSIPYSGREELTQDMEQTSPQNKYINKYNF